MELNREEKRINDTFSRRWERKVLHAIADRLPSGLMPDHMTIIGIIGSVLILTGYILIWVDRSFLFLASFGFIINWFGDSLDGTIARRRKIERPIYGFYVDHNIDAISFLMVGLGLGFSPYMRMGTALFTIIGYFMLAIYSYINAYITKEFRISFSKVGPTEVRILAVIANTIMFFVGGQWRVEILASEFGVLDFVGILIGILFLIEFFIVFFTGRKALAKLDPGPAKSPRMVHRTAHRRGNRIPLFNKLRYRDE
jgi:phosphatidylglycerophosphate synthase